MKKIIRTSRNAYHLYRIRHMWLPMLRDILKGRYKPSWPTMFVVLAACLYTLFPFDFLPDYIPLVGWADDGLVFYFLLKQIKKETVRYATHKAGR